MLSHIELNLEEKRLIDNLTIIKNRSDVKEVVINENKKNTFPNVAKARSIFGVKVTVGETPFGIAYWFKRNTEFNSINPFRYSVQGVTSEYLGLAKQMLNNHSNKEVGLNGIKGLDKYIISAKGTTVIFWKNGNKTTVRPGEGVKPDPILGFLYNYYKNNFGLTKTQYKKILGTVKDDKVKEFLIEQFKIKNHQTDPAKLVNFLNNLKVEPYEKKEKIEILHLD